MNIHENIRMFRKNNGWTMEELAKKIGTSKQTIQRYESGEIKSIPYDKIELLAKTFDIEAGTLMGWENEEAKQTGETLAQVYFEKDLLDHVTKLSKLPDSEKQLVYNMIDTLFKKGE